MRNYYDIMGLHRGSHANEIVDASQELSATVEADYFNDLDSVINNREMSTHYRRVHLQYDAMAAVLQRGTPQQDSNSWTKRLVEFSPEPNELPD